MRMKAKGERQKAKGRRKWLLYLIFAAVVLPLSGQPKTITGYYTRLPFDDGNFTGKYADIIINLPGKGKFIFSREYSYQPYWSPTEDKRYPVERLVPRKGDGPPERPDKNNICSRAAIVEKSASSIKVHWRYAPDITLPSFTDFTEAYNKAGNPSEFYSEYADEYFTINSDGTVKREVKKGCYSLDQWNNPDNRILQKLKLTGTGIVQTALIPASTGKFSQDPVKGALIKKPALKGQVVNLHFDEGMHGQSTLTKESISGSLLPVNGVKAYWRKGVSGTCLSFDSYSNSVILPSGKCPKIAGDFTVEAWIAPQEYPFNWAAITEHISGKSGFFLGMNVKGEIGFRLGSGDSIYEMLTPKVPLYKSNHIAASYGADHGMSVYINGILSASLKPGSVNSKPFNADISIGMTRSFTQYPLGAERQITRDFRTNMVFSGLIDEVAIYNRCLSEGEINLSFKSLQPAEIQPLSAWVYPDGPVNRNQGFGAQYSKLQYSPEWDGLWRVGDYSDITVTFENRPWRYVFWRGTRNLPSLVTGYGPGSVWSSDQSPESFSGQCFEHMSDMLCRYSHARLISSTDARVIVHWRNSSANIAYRWPKTDQDGWGIWTDEYWTIYPDGISVRYQVVNNNTSAPINCEMNQNEILHHPGQTTSDVLLDEAVIGANANGDLQSWSHSGKPFVKGQKNDLNLQYTNLNSKTKQFEIGETGTWIETFLTIPDYWNGWNHYPVQLIPSDGTDVSQYDRPVSTCPSTLHEVRRVIDSKTMEAIDIYGLTEKSPADLTRLNRSWNNAPAVSDVSGCLSMGYEKRERAYKFERQTEKLSFKIQASPDSPVENPAFVISNWKNSDPSVISVLLNGRKLTRGNEYKTGIETDTLGNNVLVLWMNYSAENPFSVQLN